MRQYLGSAGLHDTVAGFFTAGRPVGAICHGVLVAARARGADGRSVLADRRTTCLPAYMEGLAYALTAWKLGRYYRTYPDYVQTEVSRALDDPGRQLVRGPITLIRRGSATDDRGAFVVDDGSYVSARWPGDAWLFARTFASRIGHDRSQATPATPQGKKRGRHVVPAPPVSA